MLSKLRRLADGHTVHVWDRAEAGAWGDPLSTIERVAERWRRYRSATVDPAVTEHDDMLAEQPGGDAAYRQIGESALRVIAEAMILSGRTEFETILDLPCGGGRVTRHLAQFFPDADIHVADIDAAKQEAVVEQFAATPFAFPHDFRGSPNRSFDLVFVGSLLTHFDRKLFERALDFFIQALSDGGIAVLTTHGRNNAAEVVRSPSFPEFKAKQFEFIRHIEDTKAKIKTNFDPEKAIVEQFRKDGFGYFATPIHSSLYKQSYGGSFSSPSWLLRQIERRADCAVLGFKERSYGNMQDVLILQKL